MRPRRGLLRASAPCASAALILLAAADPAWAAAQRSGEADAFVDEGGNPTAVAGESATARGGSSGGGGDCEWRVVIEDDSLDAIYDVDGTRQYSETGRWVARFCDGEGQVAVGGFFAVPEGEGRPVDPVALARRARESVEIALPRIATSPSADRELYTQVPTWLWLDGDAWGDHTATARAGAVSSTVTARPLRTVWDAGDGGGTTCEGPGVKWREGMDEDDTDCAYTYRHSSAGEPGGTYTLSVTVVFEVAWTSNVGAGGTLPAVTRTASRPVRVGEIQAVESG